MIISYNKYSHKIHYVSKLDSSTNTIKRLHLTQTAILKLHEINYFTIRYQTNYCTDKRNTSSSETHIHTLTHEILDVLTRL